MKGERITLSAAAIELGSSYNVALRLLQTGKLEGGRDERGYFVERASVDKMRVQTRALGKAKKKSKAAA